MSRLILDVFLASRFDEFEVYRNKLSEKINSYNFLESIDLNNNLASHKSPLEESLFHVRKAEVMILLVGETYGTIPDDMKLSYTHLEYKEAIKENSNTVVLVFCIGKSYSEKHIDYSIDENMKKWQIELEKNHRLSKFNGNESIDFIIDKIINILLTTIYDRNPSENLDLEQDEELYIEDSDIDFLEDEEITFLDNKKIDNNDIERIDFNEENLEEFDLLRIPSKLASIEQKKEAQQALAIRDYSIAIMHLRKSIEFRPLDFESNYWLARLYIKSEKKSLFYDIEEHLLRAAKIAEEKNYIFKASHCYQLIVQASIFSDKEKEGSKYIKIAEELTPSFSRLYYEKAKFLLYFNNHKDAELALIQSINIKIDILKKISIDPFFKQYKSVINDVKKIIKKDLEKSYYAISSETNNIKEILEIPKDIVNIHQLSIYDLWKKTRQNFIYQYKLLINTINAEVNHIKSIDDNKIKIDYRIRQLSEEKNRKIEKYKKEKILHIKYTTRNHKYKVISVDNYTIVFDILLTILFTVLVNVYKAILNIFNKFIFKIRLDNKVKSVENRFNSKISLVEEEYNTNLNELKETIKIVAKSEINILKIFEIFESSTVTTSTSKIVPFKSLNTAIEGSIIRVTPRAYKKYLDNGYIIDILEDFPNHIKIAPNNISKYAFLAKVVSKKSNKIILSRYQAYRL